MSILLDNNLNNNEIIMYNNHNYYNTLNLDCFCKAYLKAMFLNLLFYQSHLLFLGMLTSLVDGPLNEILTCCHSIIAIKKQKNKDTEYSVAIGRKHNRCDQSSVKHAYLFLRTLHFACMVNLSHYTIQPVNNTITHEILLRLADYANLQNDSCPKTTKSFSFSQQT